VYMLSPVRLSSVTLVALLSRLKFLAIFLRHLVPWPSADIREKIYVDCPRGTPPSGWLNARGVPNLAILDLSIMVQDRKYKLLLIINRKSYISF